MNARVVALATILQVVVLVGLGIGLIFAPLTLMWAIDDSFATELPIYWATSVDVWLLGHGVPLTFTLSGELAESLSLGVSNAEFVVDVALLGVGLVTVLWGYRMGRQDSTYAYPLLVWFLAVGTLVGLTLGMVAFLPEQVVQIVWLDALVRPALFFATGLAIAAWKTSGRTGMTALESLLPGSGFLIVRSGIAAGVGSVLAVIVVAALAVAVLLVVSFAEVIGLYQALQPGLIGVVILSIGQLALLPTIIVWATTWFVGPGFSLGTGALVSPLGTNIQALPTVPILGIVPSDVPNGALAWILVPVVVAFVMGVVMAKTAAPAGKGRLWLSVTETSFFQQPLIRLASAGVVAGFVAAGLGGLLANLTSGSLGPGRFQQVGPDPLMVALWWGLEVGFGVLLGALAAAATRTSTTATR